MKIIRSSKAIRSPEFDKKRKRRRRLILGWAVAGVVTLLLVLVYGLRHSSLQIENIEVIGAEATSPREIEEIVRGELSGRYLWLLPKSNFLIYPQEHILETLSRDIPRINHISISLVGTQSLEIEISERVPDSLYCTDISDRLSPKDCYFLDNGGFVFSTAPLFSGDVYFIFSSSEPFDEPLGVQVLEEGEFKNIKSIVAGLETSGIETRALVSSGGEYRLLLDSGGEIVWKTADDLETIWTNLDAFLSDESIRAQKDFIDRVSYIDLRFDNKVFYKFKE